MEVASEPGIEEPRDAADGPSVHRGPAAPGDLGGSGGGGTMLNPMNPEAVSHRDTYIIQPRLQIRRRASSIPTSWWPPCRSSSMGCESAKARKSHKKRYPRKESVREKRQLRVRVCLLLSTRRGTDSDIARTLAGAFRGGSMAASTSHELVRPSASASSFVSSISGTCQTPS